jgi:uncharacterized BrkB/YihY/UPF0761 family membrane protein
MLSDNVSETEENPETEEDRSDGLLARSRRRAEIRLEAIRVRLAGQRERSGPLDVALRIYERDHENFGSVLGSAVAFRLFLFLFSLVVLSVGVGTLVLGQGWFGDGLSDDLGVGGAIATQVDEALRQDDSSGLILAIGGLAATAWAGKNLAITLTAASANAWRIPRPAGVTSVRAVGVVIGLVTTVMVLATVLRLVQANANVIIVATSFIAIFVAYAAVWFGLTLVLPRATRDPSSLLPGAVLSGATFALLGWVSQFYLVPRLESGSDVLGGLGITAVTLGWLFFASRIMVASLGVNAVLYERYGSFLDLLLSLPGLRRLRDRRVVQWLLEGQPSTETESESRDSSDSGRAA